MSKTPKNDWQTTQSTGLFASDKKKEELYAILTAGPISGRYQVVDSIGQGGVGLVFEAIDQRLDKQVAIKIFIADFDSNDEMDVAYDLYLKEARVAASLNHPNIVKVFDFGVLEDSPDKNPYIVMEYIAGVDLSAFYKNEHPSVPELINIYIQVSKALAYSHEQDVPVLHRDVKPKNILVGDNGKAVLIDFGFSRFLDGTTTALGIFKGSASYMAPELLQSYFSDDSDDKLRANKPAVDLYSLGASIYRSLTGKNPIAGNDALKVLDSLNNASIERPSKHNPSISPDLDQIVLALLDKNPATRLPTARELEKRLRTVIGKNSTDFSKHSAAIDCKPVASIQNSEVLDQSVLEDERFRDVEELQALRKKREESAVHKIEKNLDGKDIDQLIHLVKHQESGRKKHVFQTIGIVVGTLIFAYFILVPKRTPVSSVTATEQTTTTASVPTLGKLPMLPTDTAGAGTPVNSSIEGSKPSKKKYSKATTGKSYSSRSTSSKRKPRSTGKDLVVYSDIGKKANSKQYGVPSGTIISDVFLEHRVVSHNVETPVRAVLRSDFFLPGKSEVILREGTVFVGTAEVLPTKNRVYIRFQRAITPDQNEIALIGEAQKDDGTLGLVGDVEWDKGKTPIVQNTKNVLGVVGQAAVSGLDANSYGERVGKGALGESVKGGRKVIEGQNRPLPIITIEAYTPMRIFLSEGL